METTLFILFIAFLVFFVIQFVYQSFVFSRFSFLKPKKETPKSVPVSVLVWAKNEYENLVTQLPILVSQNYPNYELVLIDDASNDETLDLFEEYEKQYSFVKLVKVKNNEAFWGNKKFALTLGIKAAKNEYLLFTDADCRITSENWILEMTSHFSFKKTIVLGYGAYNKIKGSVLNKIIRFDGVISAIQYFSWAKIGKPYMGIGRNLAYKKSEFFNVNGFINHIRVRSGEDDLFINEAANRSNTTICYSPESFTYSEPKTTFKEWLNQKRKETSTKKHYKSFDKLQLGLYFISQLSCIVLVIILLSFQYNWIIVSSILGFRYVFNWIVFGYGASKLKEKDIIVWYPIFEIILLITQIRVVFTNLIHKPEHWK
jgi:glycosyltransferase involved in cell wall biosynthesis